MTNEQINIAIAESMGWKQPFGNTGDWERPDGSMTRTCCIPNYTTDLNACHEAFNSLNLYQQIEWHGHLYRIVKRRCAETLDDESVKMVAVNAPAKERAIAHAKTIGKWEEAAQ